MHGGRWTGQEGKARENQRTEGRKGEETQQTKED